MRVMRALNYELYLCEPDPEHLATVTTWNVEELLSATGTARHEEKR
ncbi:MAG: hypothetical protein U0X20_15525 [Caldilineaceae bacterium]